MISRRFEESRSEGFWPSTVSFLVITVLGGPRSVFDQGGARAKAFSVGL